MNLFTYSFTGHFSGDWVTVLHLWLSVSIRAGNNYFFNS